MNQTLWTHIEGTANTDIFKALPSLNGKAEISQLIASIFDEDVG